MIQIKIYEIYNFRDTNSLRLVFASARFRSLDSETVQVCNTTINGHGRSSFRESNAKISRVEQLFGNIAKCAILLN